MTPTYFFTGYSNPGFVALALAAQAAPRVSMMPAASWASWVIWGSLPKTPRDGESLAASYFGSVMTLSEMSDCQDPIEQKPSQTACSLDKI